MRSVEAEVAQLALAAFDPHARIAELEHENATLRRLLTRAANRQATLELAANAR